MRGARLRGSCSSSSRLRRHNAVVCHTSKSGMSSTTHYEVLGITCQASDQEIKAAYRKLALKLHPDVNPSAEQQERFVQCNLAYEVLSDARKRAAHDQELAVAARSRSSSFSHYGASSTWAEEVMWAEQPRPAGDAHTGRGHDDMDDSDDHMDVDELLYEMEFTMWSSTGSNYRSSFTSSFDGANGRKRRAAAAARAERAARESGATSSKGGTAGRKQGMGNRVWEEWWADELLAGLGPEVRMTAKKVFGQRLEKLGSKQELADFLEAMETLQDTGIAFDLFSSTEARATYHHSNATQQQGGKAQRRGGQGNPACPEAAVPPLSQHNSKSSRSNKNSSSSSSSSSSNSSTSRSSQKKTVSTAHDRAVKQSSSRTSTSKPHKNRPTGRNKPLWVDDDDVDEEETDDGWYAIWATDSDGMAAGARQAQTSYPDPFADLFGGNAPPGSSTRTVGQKGSRKQKSKQRADDDGWLDSWAV